MYIKMTREKQTTILVTGGAGYVGSHSVLLLLNQKYRVVVVDNCLATPMSTNLVDDNGNSRELPESLRRVELLAGKQLTHFQRLDLVDDTSDLDEIFHRFNIKAVIHYAALKSVSESIGIPLEYYTNNLIGTINLLNVMKRHGCKLLIFSSSATVYGLPQYLPVDEKHQVGLNLLNPYGRTKYMIEQILEDLCKSSSKQEQSTTALANSNGNSNKWRIISLRYFNPVGAHPSGIIGEHIQGVPNNLMPYVSQVSIGKRKTLYVFGNNFDTVDGTGVRDYIHIMDLASGHTHALDYLLEDDQWTGEDGYFKQSTYRAFNLGTGTGYSVLDIIKTFETVNGVKVPYEVTGRREGDAGSVYADANLAFEKLNWRSKYTIVEMVRDTYKWQSSNPEGFKSMTNDDDYNGSSKILVSSKSDKETVPGTTIVGKVDN